MGCWPRAINQGEMLPLEPPYHVAPNSEVFQEGAQRIQACEGFGSGFGNFNVYLSKCIDHKMGSGKWMILSPE